MGSAKMITIRLTYYEVMERDFTAVDAEILRGKRRLAFYRNYDPRQLDKEIYANQAEEFSFPTTGAARKFLESSGCYHQI